MSGGVPLGCPLVVALGEPERTLTALASHRGRGVGIESIQMRTTVISGEGNMGGGDEGKRQERMPIKSQARVAYVCRASNSAAPSVAKRGNTRMAVTLPAYAR